MKTLLIINASGRVTRSITRRLTNRLAEAWRTQHSDHIVVHRDVGLYPPPSVNEAWIAGAFADPAQRAPAMQDALRLSETLVEELSQADALVIGTPMYNFGMPAQLKAYVDQVVRIGRTFAFDPAATPHYRPLLSPKPVLVITAAGDGSTNPGGALHHLNFLDGHLRTVLEFIGLSEVDFVRVGFDEFQDDRLKQSLAAAETAVDQWVARVSPAVEHYADR